MPYNFDKPWIQAGVLHIPPSTRGGEETQIAVDSDAWRNWVQEGTSFYVFAETGDNADNFSCRTTRRKQAGKQRGGLYWSAVRRHGSHVVQVYIGPPEMMTAQRLAAVPAQMADQISKLPSAEEASEEEQAPDRFADIRERLQAITPGPLEVGGTTVYRRVSPQSATAVATFHSETAEADAQFFAHAAEDIERLLDAVGKRKGKRT